MTDDLKLRARAEAFVVLMRKMHKRLGEELDIIEATLRAEATPGQIAKDLLDRFCLKWKERHRGEAYIVGGEGAKLIGMLKRLLTGKTPLEPAEIDRRMGVYFASRDPFIVNAKYPLEMFVKGINKYSGARAIDDASFLTAPPPGDCRHSPRCRTDVEHTEKRRREMRA